MLHDKSDDKYQIKIINSLRILPDIFYSYVVLMLTMSKGKDHIRSIVLRDMHYYQIRNQQKSRLIVQSNTDLYDLSKANPSLRSFLDLVSGFLILVNRPYEINDMIEIIDEEKRGYVEDITLRYTKILTLEIV